MKIYKIKQFYKIILLAINNRKMKNNLKKENLKKKKE